MQLILNIFVIVFNEISLYTYFIHSLYLYRFIYFIAYLVIDSL